MSRAGLSSQMAQMRASIEKDSQLGSLMAGLRGSNMNSSDFAEDGVVMQLVAVEADEAEQLPLVYNPDAIAAFWSRRPIAVARRVVQLLRLGWPLVAGLAWDLAWGRLQVIAKGCMPPLGGRAACLVAAVVVPHMAPGASLAKAGFRRLRTSAVGLLSRDRRVPEREAAHDSAAA